MFVMAKGQRDWRKRCWTRWEEEEEGSQAKDWTYVFVCEGAEQATEVKLPSMAQAGKSPPYETMNRKL